MAVDLTQPIKLGSPDYVEQQVIRKLDALGTSVTDPALAARVTQNESDIAALVSDDTYGAGWNGVTDVAPSKNAVYDKIEAITPNATHTGEVTGATTLTVDKTAITNRSAVSPAVGDFVLVSDVSNSDNLAKARLRGIGGLYRPAMMQYDGSTGFYSKGGLTVSGNKVTSIALVRAPKDPGSSVASVLAVRGGSARLRTSIRFYGSSQATPALRNKIVFQVVDSANVTKCLLASTDSVNWGASLYMIFASFDGDIGAATFYIDGVDADDTGNASRVAPTTATLDTGTGAFYVGSGNSPIVEASLIAIGYVGHREAYLTNWSDFMSTEGAPLELDETGWTQWGAQPMFFNPHGQMDNNRGSGGNMTKNGTINVSMETFGLSTGLVV